MAQILQGGADGIKFLNWGFGDKGQYSVTKA